MANVKVGSLASTFLEIPAGNRGNSSNGALATRISVPLTNRLRPGMMCRVHCMKEFSAIQTYSTGKFIAEPAGPKLPLIWHRPSIASVTCTTSASDDVPVPSSTTEGLGFAVKYPALVTGFFFFTSYFLNVIFNILNKKIYNYFPFPYFVSVIHLGVGVAYCAVSWLIGAPKRAPIDKELLILLTPVAACRAWDM